MTGRQTVGSRGELAVPAAARALAGFERGSPVLLVAVADRDVLMVHSHALLGPLLVEFYAAEHGDDR
jgi:bifunctional DNA-binding transcriptional regulator/antitoxin component of YhaV-PrlF toxin-antitoxin module